MTDLSAAPLPVPSLDPQEEARRRRSLRNHKAMATGLLVLATLIFLASSWYQAQFDIPPVWVGYVRAAAEAGMVGALADWFAVTALFRHPLGIPIPHTAIIPRKKDQVGEALAGFVGENFLNAELITDKLRKADVPKRAGEWLREEANATKVSTEAASLATKALHKLSDEQAAAILKATVIDRLAEPDWGPPLGRALESLLKDGADEPIIDQLAGWLHTKSLTAGPLIERLVGDRSPKWAPSFIRDMVGDRVHRELVDWTWQVKHDPQHEARHGIRRFLVKFVEDLQHDPKTIAKVEELKADLLASAPVANAASSLWATAKAALLDQAEHPDSVIRTKLTENLVAVGERLVHEETLRATVDARITDTARFLADNYSEELTGIISETVQRWDGREAGEKIELMVGKDLQFIRVNGTLVGALAGLVIYAIAHALF